MNDVADTQLIHRTTLSAIVAHRDAALTAIDEAIALLQDGHLKANEALEHAERAYGAAVFYGEDRSKLDAYRRLFESFDGTSSREAFRAQLDARTWTHLMILTGLDTLMDRTAKDELHRSLCEEVPEVTEPNVIATFRRYKEDAGLIFQRGLARCFGDLDRRFKSHDAFRFKHRIVLANCFDRFGHWHYSSGMRETITDVERTLAILAGGSRDYVVGSVVRDITEARGHGLNPRAATVEGEFFRVRTFKNGHAHLWFTRKDLVDKANQVLADYYGRVMPDGVDAATSAEDLKTTCTALAKDLSYYWTPEPVVRRLLDGLNLSGLLVLEPSAGTGHIVQALLREGATVEAVEVHPERVRELSRIPYAALNVRARNFLTMPPSDEFDYVIMNPPFSGTHWMDHVRHAFKFLRPNGELRAVVPISAEVGDSPKHEEFRKWAEAHKCNWSSMFEDLPAESFASAGTRINTVILRLRRKV